MRFRPPDIEPLEVWDLAVAGETLFASREREDFCQRLAEAVELIATRHPRGAEIDQVFACGGGSVRPELRSALARSGRIVEISPLGQFACEPAGFHLLNGRFGLVVDAGQSALKLFWPGGRLLFPRDFDALPIAGPSALRPKVHEFMAAAIREASNRAVRPFELVVLALPSEIDDDLHLAGSSYPGMADDRDLVDDVLRRAKLDLTSIVLNDAELAAMTAGLVMSRRCPTLVLTIGFGVGAALLLPGRALKASSRGAP